jgi:hypothetical protein
MKGHFGALLTSGLAGIALALVLLQAFVVARSHGPLVQYTAAPAQPSNRFSAPGNRSAIPWGPFDRAQQTPVPQKPEQRHVPTPPPSRYHSFPPRMGPTPPRRATA